MQLSVCRLIMDCIVLFISAPSLIIQTSFSTFFLAKYFFHKVIRHFSWIHFILNCSPLNYIYINLHHTYSISGLGKKNDASEKSSPEYQENIKSRNLLRTNLDNHRDQEPFERETQNITRRLDDSDNYQLSDDLDLDTEEDTNDPEYYYYYYYGG